jgi:hypothetical protein
MENGYGLVMVARATPPTDMDEAETTVQSAASVKNRQRLAGCSGYLFVFGNTISVIITIPSPNQSPRRSLVCHDPRALEPKQRSSLPSLQ